MPGGLPTFCLTIASGGTTIPAAGFGGASYEMAATCWAFAKKRPLFETRYGGQQYHGLSLYTSVYFYTATFQKIAKEKLAYLVPEARIDVFRGVAKDSEAEAELCPTMVARTVACWNLIILI